MYDQLQALYAKEVSSTYTQDIAEKETDQLRSTLFLVLQTPSKSLGGLVTTRGDGRDWMDGRGR